MDLVHAAQEGKTDECERLLLSGADPNSSDKVCKGPFILHCNCYRGITVFQVKINSTFMRHRNAVTLHACAARQRNTIAV